LSEIALSGQYSNLINAPVLSDVATSGSYNDLSHTPSLSEIALSGQYSNLINAPVLSDVATSGSYNDLSHTPSLSTVATSGSYNDLSHTPSLSTVAISGSYNDLSNKPSLSTVAISGSYNDLSDTPSLYTDVDARNACFPLTTSNTGLELINNGLNIFDNRLWYNSIDGIGRLYFLENDFTLINAPNTGLKRIAFKIGYVDKLQINDTNIISYNDIQIGNGTGSNKSLFLWGENNSTQSSTIVFNDSGSTTPYRYGMTINYNSYDNRLEFSGDNNNDAYIDNPPIMTLTRATKNVGIGTTSPDAKLDVNGDINISSGSSFKINGSAIATTDTTYSAGTGISISGTTINSQITQYEDSNVLTLLNTTGVTGGLKVISGNVGIGTTSPQTKLHVYVDSDTVNNLVEVLRLERHCNDMSSSANAEGGYISLKVDDDNASFGEAARISWRADNSDDTEDSGRLGFWTSKDDSCTEKLTITKDGNTGIGISNPSKKLDVAGDINLSGWIYKNNLLLNTTTILKYNVSFDSTSYDSVLQHKRGHINYSPNWRGSTTRYCLIDLILRPTGYWGVLWHWSHNPTRYSRIMLKETYNTYNSPATYDYSVQSVNNDLLGRTDYGLDLSFNGSQLVFNIGPNDNGYIWNYIGYTLIELIS
jgi:hypothetical protein